MYVCNCRVAKVNDDGEELDCPMQHGMRGRLSRCYYFMYLLLGSTTNPSPSHIGRMQKCLASTIAYLQRILHRLHLSLPLSLPLVLPTTNITNLNLG